MSYSLSLQSILNLLKSLMAIFNVQIKGAASYLTRKRCQHKPKRQFAVLNVDRITANFVINNLMVMINASIFVQNVALRIRLTEPWTFFVLNFNKTSKKKMKSADVQELVVLQSLNTANWNMQTLFLATKYCVKIVKHCSVLYVILNSDVGITQLELV